MAGISNISEILKNMTPRLNEGEYVFVTVQCLDEIPLQEVICFFREKEGVTIIIEKSKADSLKLKYTYTAAWITLNVHSSLNAVGLTAAFSNELANNGLSCNVVAGYYHDHIFVEYQDANRALEVLVKL
ncbi:ACT domain-containing protein [Crocinitomicaceae bacterium]|nr:ACT domain-containing protein [Crocinitomicaceae bacterium]